MVKSQYVKFIKSMKELIA